MITNADARKLTAAILYRAVRDCKSSNFHHARRARAWLWSHGWALALLAALDIDHAAVCDWLRDLPDLGGG